MTCFSCDAPARGICHFCGRAVCKNCIELMPSILTVFIGKDDTPKAVVVSDALWCQQCTLEPDPIAMPEIY